MLERVTVRVAQISSRAADYAPVAPACCNVCRTCTTTNVVGLVTGAALALAYGTARLVGGVRGRSRDVAAR